MAETTYSWAETRERAAKAFGGRWPDAELEAELIEEFRERPAFVVDAIADVSRGFQAGRVHSPWPFLRTRIRQRPAVDVVITDDSQRDKKIAVTEAWIKSTGRQFPTADELEDELFGDRGRLRQWSGDELLRERLMKQWLELQDEPASDWVGDEP